MNSLNNVQQGVLPLGVRRDLNGRSSRFKALPLSHVRTLWARHSFLWPGAWFLTCCLVAALPVTVYTERSRITIQRERLILSLASYQIVPLVVAFLPAYHPVCIVNRLLIDVQSRTIPFGTADGNYSNTMTCRSEIKVRLWSGRYWIMSVFPICS